MKNILDDKSIKCSDREKQPKVIPVPQSNAITNNK